MDMVTENVMGSTDRTSEEEDSISEKMRFQAPEIVKIPTYLVKALSVLCSYLILRPLSLVNDTVL